MQQHIVKFKLPHGVTVYPYDLRKGVAKTLNDPSMDPIFNYQNGQGVDAYPHSRFIGGKGWVGYVSEVDEAMVNTVLAPCIKVLNNMKINAGVEMITQTRSASPSDEPIIYALSGGVDKSKNKKLHTRSDEAYMQHMIWRMLENAVKQGILDILPTEDELNLRIYDTRSVGIPAGHNNGEGKLFYNKTSGQFSMNLNLKGIWQAGQLLSRGYGMIYKKNRGGFFQC